MKIVLAVDGSGTAVRADPRQLVETVAWYKETPQVELVTVQSPVSHVGPFARVVISQDIVSTATIARKQRRRLRREDGCSTQQGSG